MSLVHSCSRQRFWTHYLASQTSKTSILHPKYGIDPITSPQSKLIQTQK
jgi:hypothetical protein